MKKISIALIAGCIFLCGVAKFYSSRPSSMNDRLIVGVMSGYEPYASINEQGMLEGFDIDVAKLIAQKLHKQIEFRDMSLSALLIALEQNKIDIILSGLSITPERQDRLAMIYYQGKLTTQYPLLFWKKIPQGLASIEDIKNIPDAIVCVEPGSAQESFLLQFDFLKLKRMNVMSEIVMDLKYGKSYAALLDPDIVPTLKQQFSELVSLDIQLPKEYQSKGCGIAVNKQKSDLINAIRAVIDELRRDGTLTCYEKKWFKKGDKQ